jgi:hypothetical protein
MWRVAESEAQRKIQDEWPCGDDRLKAQAVVPESTQGVDIGRSGHHRFLMLQCTRISFAANGTQRTHHQRVVATWQICSWRGTLTPTPFVGGGGSGKPCRRMAEASEDKTLRALCLARLATCQGGANAGEQAIVTTWLAQIANYTVGQRPSPMGIIRGSGDQDRWDISTGRGEVPIQVKPSHHRHVYVQDQARCARQIRRVQKILSRRKGLHRESSRSKETSKRLPHRIIIIYY